jgi:homoserine O-acetyltransferase
MQKAIERIPHAKLLVVPASAETMGHSTTGNAKFWKREIAELLAAAPRRN